MIKKIISFLKSKIWYILLLILSTVYVFVNRQEIYSFKELNSINLVFILWLLLLMLPLFSEMEFFGIKLKKEVEKVKGEFGNDINKLKEQIIEIKNTNIVSSSNIYSINNVQLPTEKEVHKTLEELKSVYKGTVDLDEMVTDESIFLFKIRYSLEKFLTNFASRIGYEGNNDLFRTLDYILKHNIISYDSYDQIRKILAICNRGIHGEIVSNEYIELTKYLLPIVLNEINSATMRFGYKCFVICPKCNYTGFTEIEGECPRCKNKI